MKNTIRYILLSVMAFAAVSSLSGCRVAEQSGRGTVESVERILSGEGRGYALLKGFDARDSRGSIALIGPRDRNDSLAIRFITNDDFDNIDGRRTPDLLPDFAGEVFDIIADDANSPYSSFLGSDTDGLRSVAVQNFISAIDTACSMGAFDDELLTAKEGAKIVVLTSPLQAESGAFDIDTLCRSLGAPVPVIFPSRQAFENQLDRDIPHLHVAVMTDGETAESGVYPRVFDEIARQRGILGVGCIAFARDTLAPLTSFLSDYKSSGGNMPISAIIVDDLTVSVSDVQAAFDYIMTVQNETNLDARKLLTKDCVVVDMQKEVTDKCHSILRTHNIFTHNIAYPAYRRYSTVRSTSGEGYKLVEQD